MDLSIVIPTLNEEKLLPNLLNQFEDERLKKILEFEIIISDGGSVDDSLKIAKSNSLVIVRNEISGEIDNIAKGRNRGAKKAKGDFLLFINADIKISLVLKLFEIIKSHIKSGEFVAATFPVKIFPEEEIASDRLFLGFYNIYFHFLNIIGVGMGRGECQLISKSIFELVGGNNENLIAGEDFDLYRRIRKIGKVHFIKNIEIYESPRRFRKFGHLKIFFSWLGNSISMLLVKKSISKEWETIR